VSWGVSNRKGSNVGMERASAVCEEGTEAEAGEKEEGEGEEEKGGAEGGEEEEEEAVGLPSGVNAVRCV
jgi:hypothetical protein